MFPSNTLSENWRCLLRDFYLMTLRGPLRELSFGYACWPAIQAGLPPQIKQTNKKGHWTRSRQTHLCALQARMYTEQLDTFYLKSWTLHLKTFANKSLLGELEFKFWSVSNPSNLR